MTFKVLPQQPFSGRSLTHADDDRLAKQPVGSGPYVYKGQETRNGHLSAIFAANPCYASRPGKAGLPQIREIQLFVLDDPVKEFVRGNVDLATDVAADQVKALQSRGVKVSDPLRNRRVYFLALNHRKSVLKNQDLRRALALAVERDKILDSCFRGDLGKRIHRPLNGPYPPDSWVADPGLPALDQPDVARSLIKKAEEAGLRVKKLSLKYPDNDPRVAQAMEMLRGQVQEALGIDLELVPLDPHQLRRDVEQTHDYDLAYYAYDYPSEAYWLWPLFDPRGVASGRSNYLGYTGDSELAKLFSEVQCYRDCAEVRSRTRSIHAHMQSKMPLVPLWQLDTLIATDTDLQTVSYDPLLVFTDVDQWTLRRK